MKITHRQLSRLIKEELGKRLKESWMDAITTGAEGIHTATITLGKNIIEQWIKDNEEYRQAAGGEGTQGRGPLFADDCDDTCQDKFYAAIGQANNNSVYGLDDYKDGYTEAMSEEDVDEIVETLSGLQSG